MLHYTTYLFAALSVTNRHKLESDDIRHMMASHVREMYVRRHMMASHVRDMYVRRHMMASHVRDMYVHH